MPKKAKPKPKKLKKPGKPKTSKTSEDVIEQRFGHFSEEITSIGEKLGAHMERKGDECNAWFHRTFGLAGPLISSIFGLIILVLAVWALSFVNIPIGSQFLSNIYMFLVLNMGLFFLIFLFFSYTSYFSKTSPRSYMLFSPLVTTIGIAIGLWIVSRAIEISNISVGSQTLADISLFLDRNLAIIFVFILIIGYILLSIKLGSEPLTRREVEMPTKKSKKEAKPEIRRLYRSGNDRILGGVCGGIGDYLGVDPVIIRILWVLFALVYGVGILGYIIAWIIIPRNPEQKWE
jgi:phage shock protein PspC (stress-responsive transcriptional regulator)